MVFRLGPAMRGAVPPSTGIEGTDFDVMVNPKYIVQTKQRPSCAP